MCLATTSFPLFRRGKGQHQAPCSPTLIYDNATDHLVDGIRGGLTNPRSSSGPKITDLSYLSVELSTNV